MADFLKELISNDNENLINTLNDGIREKSNGNLSNALSIYKNAFKNAQTDDEKSCILQLILHIYTDLTIGTVQEIRKIDAYHEFSWDWSGDNIPNNYKTPKISEILDN